MRARYFFYILVLFCVNSLSELQGIPGGVGGMGVLEECIIAEEFAFGCTGICTAIGGTGLGVSFLYIHKAAGPLIILYYLIGDWDLYAFDVM